MPKYGFDDTDWNAAKTEAREAIIERARVRGQICYSDLMARIESIDMDPHDPRVSPFLAEISLAEHADGRPLLTAIVTHKTGDMQPGPGFYDLAKRVGRNTSDLVKCWVDEFKKVHAYWEAH